MLKISQTCCAAQPLFKLILHAKAKAFAARFWSHFNARGFTNRSKSFKNQLRSNNLHYHCCFLSPKSCFKSVICRQNLLVKRSDLHVFAKGKTKETVYQTTWVRTGHPVHSIRIPQCGRKRNACIVFALISFWTACSFSRSSRKTMLSEKANDLSRVIKAHEKKLKLKGSLRILQRSASKDKFLTPETKHGEVRIPGPAIYMCRWALKNEVYNNSFYSYSMRCNWLWRTIPAKIHCLNFNFIF